MTLGVGVDHVIDAACPYQVAGRQDDDAGEVVVTADAKPGVPVRIIKYAAYQASRGIEVPELVDRCRRTLDRAVRDGFDALVAYRAIQGPAAPTGKLGHLDAAGGLVGGVLGDPDRHPWPCVRRDRDLARIVV